MDERRKEDDNCIVVKPGALPQLPFLLPALLMSAPAACPGSVVWCSDVTVSVLGARETVQREGASSREEAQSRCRERRVHRSSAALLVMVVVLLLYLAFHNMDIMRSRSTNMMQFAWVDIIPHL